MGRNKNESIKNLATIFNKPYTPPKEWVRVVLTRDNRRITSMNVEVNSFDTMVMRWNKLGINVQVEQ